MSPKRVNQIVLIDTGVWLGLCDRRDGQAAESNAIFEQLESVGIAMPWPLWYEVLKTRVVKQPRNFERFNRAIKTMSVLRIDDTKYRENALQATLDSGATRRPFSLVDMVCRLVIIDLSIRIDAVATYNVGDFADVCRKRDIPLISSAREIDGL